MTHTPEEAADLLCPLSRVFGAKDLTQGCRGPECAVWRWAKPMADDFRFQSAIKREMLCMAQEKEKETGKPVSSERFHKEAVAKVMKNPEGYDCMKLERGWCGLGLRPEV